MPTSMSDPDADARRARPLPPDRAGDWDFLSEGYYRLQDAELAGEPAAPSCADALDAYVVPIALQKAEMAGLAVPEWFLANEWFPVDVLVYAVNPFTRGHAIVRTEEQQRVAAKRLTWRYKYTVCCQRLGPATELVEFRAVAGRCADPAFAAWAEAVARVFRLPLATVRLLRTGDVTTFSSIARLPGRTLTREERAWLDAGAPRRG